MTEEERQKIHGAAGGSGSLNSLETLIQQKNDDVKESVERMLSTASKELRKAITEWAQDKVEKAIREVAGMVCEEIFPSD